MQNNHHSGRSNTEDHAAAVPARTFRNFVYNPAYICILITASVFVTEALLMVILQMLSPLPPYAEALIDASALTVVLVPLMYFFFYRPFSLNIESRDNALNLRDNAIYEWDRTMNCVGEMIAILDADKKMRKVNNAMREFMSVSDENILGMDWIAFLREHHIPVPPNSSESQMLFHEPTGTWFELNFYPLQYKGDNGDVVEGTIISFHNITEMKLVTGELERANKKIELSRNRLRFALTEVSKIIEIVTKKSDTKIRLNNPHLQKCYEVKNCTKKDCACYGREAVRCWQIAGTFCGGEVQGAFAEKYGNCTKCEVFQTATSDPIFGIAEQFNNMMQVITNKHNELKNAYEGLKNAQSRGDTKKDLPVAGTRAGNTN